MCAHWSSADEAARWNCKLKPEAISFPWQASVGLQVQSIIEGLKFPQVTCACHLHNSDAWNKCTGPSTHTCL